MSGASSEVSKMERLSMKMYEILPSGHSWAAESMGDSAWRARRDVERSRVCLKTERWPMVLDRAVMPRNGRMMAIRSFLGRKEIFLIFLFLFLLGGC